MPIRTPTPMRRRAGHGLLRVLEVLELIVGPAVGVAGKEHWVHFPNRETARAAWLENRARVLAEYPAQKGCWAEKQFWEDQKHE